MNRISAWIVSGMNAAWNVALASSVLVPAAALASAAPVQEPSAMKLLYSGNFDWKGAALRFELGALPQAAEGRSRFVALIKDATGKVQGACARVWEESGRLSASSMTLRCEGALFGKPGSLARFSFEDLRANPRLTLVGGSRSQEFVVRPL